MIEPISDESHSFLKETIFSFCFRFRAFGCLRRENGAQLSIPQGKMRKFSLVCLVLAAAGRTANAATRGFEPGNKAMASTLPSIDLLSVKAGGAKAPPPPEIPVVVELTEQDKSNIHTRRPSAEKGFRYSSNDWLVNLITTPLSYTLKRVRVHVLVNVGISFLAIHLFNKHGKEVRIPMTGHSLLGSSLGLLLSYRTNSAYGRFWEARGYWTNSKVYARNLAILVKYHISACSPKAAAKLLNILVAYPGALMFLCLGGNAKLPDYTQKCLPDHPLEYAEAPNLPSILLLTELQKIIHEAKMESRSSRNDLVEAAHLQSASHMVEQLMHYMASCEKILRTPVPWTYSRHTSRFLTIWLGTLPFTLIGDMKPWLVVAIVAAASYCMIGIEEIGHMIEQPFLGDPLDGEEKIELMNTSINNDNRGLALIKRGQLTQPYDTGIPVCSLAAQMRKEIQAIMDARSSH